MTERPRKREQRRLMSMESNSGVEYVDEHDSLCRDYDGHHAHGCCHKIMQSKTAKLGIMLFLIVGYFFAELIVGNFTKSLTLVADSFHMLSDALSLVVALSAVRMSKRTATVPFRPWLSKEPYFNTFGWVRFEVLGALINSTFLLALCVSIILEVIEKFINPEPVGNPKLVLAVGGGGLVLNLFGLIMFGSHAHGHHHHGHSHKSGNSHQESDSESSQKTNVSAEHLNMKAVFLHVLGDALGSVIVMISATVLWLVPVSEEEEIPWTWYLDPGMSLILVLIMVCTTIPLFKQSSMILLQTVPKHIRLTAVRGKLLKIVGIQAIHDLHIWQLTGERIIASVHVQCTDANAYLDLVGKIKVALHDEGIHSCTVQPEFSYSDTDQLPFCQLECGDSCSNMTCCPSDKPDKTKQANGSAAPRELEEIGPNSQTVLKDDISIVVKPHLDTTTTSTDVKQETGFLSNSICAAAHNETIAGSSASSVEEISSPVA